MKFSGGIPLTAYRQKRNSSARFRVIERPSLLPQQCLAQQPRRPVTDLQGTVPRKRTRAGRAAGGQKVVEDGRVTPRLGSDFVELGVPLRGRDVAPPAPGPPADRLGHAVA